MKVCIVGTSINQPTGYAKVVYNMLKELVTTGLEVHHYSIQKSTLTLRRPIADVITHEVEDFGVDGLKDYCETNAINLVLIYNDITTTLTYLKAWKPPRCWVYLDTVGHGIRPDFLKLLDDSVERVYLMSNYWKSIYSFKNTRVIEHGVDTEVFRPVEVSDLRRKLGIPENAIVFLNCNRNSRRKRLDLTVQAFVLFCKRNPNSSAHLLLITTKDGFYDIGSVLYNEIARHKYDCSSRVRTIFNDRIVMTDNMMNEFYNIADFGLNTSYGEGYGLTALEHLAIGKPQVLTALPSYTFVDDSVVLVKSTGEREYDYKEDIIGYFEHWKAEDFALGMEQVLDKKTHFASKSWKKVMSGFVNDLKEEFPQKELCLDKQVVEIPMLTA
jgi:glycosyltransferase involved in cell wall biosynthesis